MGRRLKGGGRNISRYAKKWGRTNAYLLGNGAGKGRWSTNNRGRVKGFGRHYKQRKRGYYGVR